MRVHAYFREEDVAVNDFRVTIVLLFPLICLVRLYNGDILRGDNFNLPVSLFIGLVISWLVTLNRYRPLWEVENGSLYLSFLGTRTGRRHRSSTGNLWSRECLSSFYCVLLIRMSEGRARVHSSHQ